MQVGLSEELAGRVQQSAVAPAGRRCVLHDLNGQRVRPAPLDPCVSHPLQAFKPGAKGLEIDAQKTLSQTRRQCFLHLQRGDSLEGCRYLQRQHGLIQQPEGGQEHGGCQHSRCGQ